MYYTRALKQTGYAELANDTLNPKVYLDLACHYRYTWRHRTTLPTYDVKKFQQKFKVEKLMSRKSKRDSLVGGAN